MTRETTTRIEGIATALPPHPLPQAEVARRAEALLGPRFAGFDKLRPSFARSGVEMRHSVAPIVWFEAARGWTERNEMYLAGAEALWRAAAQAALAAAGWEAAAVDVVVTISSTGIATPTLEARAAADMGFRADLQRVPVFGLGCAGGVMGLSIAAAQAAARPGARVLLVVVETCTLGFRAERPRKADVVAAMLFGDGAAAACLRAGRGGRDGAIRLGAAYQHSWPGTLGIMGWDVTETGLAVVFDRAIPPFVSEHFAPALAAARAAGGQGAEAPLVCHPGGARVIEALEAAAGVPEGTLAAERAVLRRCGNMSAPTVLFVLEEAIADGLSGPAMLCALGPGFTAAFQAVEIGSGDG